MLALECKMDKFAFEHDYPEDFTMCYWHKHRKVVLLWITYRFLLTIYFLFIFLVAIFCRPEKGFVWYKNVLYISSLILLFEFLLFGMAFGITVARFLKEKKDPELRPLKKMPWKYKTLWFWYNLAAGNSIVVTVMFWLLLYRPDPDTNLTFEVGCKLFNSVLLIIDYIFCNFPYRVLHMYIPCLFIIIYSIFTIVYQFSGGTGNLNAPSLYSITDWRQPLEVFLFMMMYIAMCVFSHCGMYTLYALKLWLKSRQR